MFWRKLIFYNLIIKWWDDKWKEIKRKEKCSNGKCGITGKMDKQTIKKKWNGGINYKYEENE